MNLRMHLYPHEDYDPDNLSLAGAGALRARGGAMPLRRRVARGLKKVPEITIYFWIIKLLTTAMGEVTSDFLVHQLDPIIAVAIGGLALAVALVLQFAVRRYVPWVYWLAVVGEVTSDFLVHQLDPIIAVAI